MTLVILALAGTAAAYAQSPTVEPDRETFSVKLGDREEQHQWQRFVRSFRQGHHFSLSGGRSNATWYVENFGEVTDATYETTGWDSTFTYAFFLPIYRKLGYYLGTSAGFSRYASEISSFTPPLVTKYPGVVSGVAYAPHPGLRFGGGLNAYLERWDGILARHSSGTTRDLTRSIEITTETVDINAFCDVFWALPWALRIEAHEVRSFFIRPREPIGAMGSRLSRVGRVVGLGFVYHLL